MQPPAPAWHRPMQPFALAWRSKTPPVLYVLVSFALMMLLAATLSVVGSVAALVLLDESETEVLTKPAEVTPPAASLSR
jgi:hypothetical protein